MDFGDRSRMAFRYRKVFLCLVGAVLIWWLYGYRIFQPQVHYIPEPRDSCLGRKLAKYRNEIALMDSVAITKPLEYSSESFIPFVGNGYIGLSMHENAHVIIKHTESRVLNVAIPFQPFVRIFLPNEDYRKEAIVTQYLKGSSTLLSCIGTDFGDSVDIESKLYAHRAIPSVLVQEVVINNPKDNSIVVSLDQKGWNEDNLIQGRSVRKRMTIQDAEVQYLLVTGMMKINGSYVALCLVASVVPTVVNIPAHSKIRHQFVASIKYDFVKDVSAFGSVQHVLVNYCVKDFKSVVSQNPNSSSRIHEKAWGELWSTGFSITPSLAFEVLNGDRINSTIYYVLSQVRDPLHESESSPMDVAHVKNVMSYAEGCYGGHHTLQARNLWAPLNTENQMLNVSSLWLLTLEKWGCHKLLKAGASGVIQAMVLSFGAFKFSNSHLEFNTFPKDLHRGYHFRRIWYGNSTHVNVSVSISPNNKALLHVALDRSDTQYYACDAGCLDPPVELGATLQTFPVKMTEPITSILYITSDRKHVEELRLSIHVKEIFEAPAHDHHVISLHKHGSNYGAFSTMFWIGVSFIIVIFHIFLFHLVYTEYFGNNYEKYRTRPKIAELLGMFGHEIAEDRILDKSFSQLSRYFA